MCGRCHPTCATCEAGGPLDCTTCAEGFSVLGETNSSCLPILNRWPQQEGPVAQYVKESEGRGIRAKDNPAEPDASYWSSWIVGAGASILAGLTVVVVVQLRSRWQSTRYSSLPVISTAPGTSGQRFKRDHQMAMTKRRAALGRDSSGAQTLLLSSSTEDLPRSDDDDDSYKDDDDVIPRV